MEFHYCYKDLFKKSKTRVIRVNFLIKNPFALIFKNSVDLVTILNQFLDFKLNQWENQTFMQLKALKISILSFYFF